MASRSNNQSLFDMMRRVAAETGVSFDTMRRFAGIESSYNPGAKTGSYKGLFQLSNSEFKRGGGTGSIYNAEANTRAFANVIKEKSAKFEKQMGRPPTGPDLYMLHQQGEQGGVNHLRNPDAPAWKNMAATGEGRQKGERWAKKAIWGNVPTQMKKQFGSVENISSRDFTGMWSARFHREGSSGSWGPADKSAPAVESTGRAKLRAPEAAIDVPSKRVAADVPFDKPTGLDQHSYRTLADEIKPTGEPVGITKAASAMDAMPKGLASPSVPAVAPSTIPSAAPSMPQRRPELEGLTPGGSNVYGENPPASPVAASAAPSSRPQAASLGSDAAKTTFSYEELNRVFGGEFGSLYGAPSDKMASGPVRIDPPPGAPPLAKDFLYPMFGGGFFGGAFGGGN